ncbi:MAG: hypothetical protein J6W35_06995 [Eubacterium sp.]|nr:hypothetical protein [Eubacterium sp.]
MAEKERNEFIFELWSVLIHIINLVFTFYSVLMLSRFLENSDLLTPLGYILIVRFMVVLAVWSMICHDYDFSTKPKKLSTLEKAQREINKGEYKKQLKEDKEELKRRKGISKVLKYIEHEIVVDAKKGYREITYDLPIEYCVKDVELYLQNHGFDAEIKKGILTYDSMLHPCYPLHIEW